MKPLLSAMLLGLMVPLSVPAGAAFTAAAADTRQILAEQRQIHEDIEDPMGKYSRFDARAHAELREAQARVFSLLEGGRSLEQMNAQEQAALLNAVEQIKAILAGNEEDRLHCWREKKVGSQMKTTRCATVAELRQTREDARGFKSDVGVCAMGEGGGPTCGPAGLRPSSRGY